MEAAAAIFDWFRDADNRAAVQAITATLVVFVAWATGLVGWIVRQVRRPPPEKPTPPTIRQRADHGGVNVAGNARDVSTTVNRADDPS
jgi:hypothetical protein